MARGLGRGRRSSEDRKTALGRAVRIQVLHRDTQQRVLSSRARLCATVSVPGLEGIVRSKWIISQTGEDSVPVHSIHLINTICDDDHGHHDGDGDGPDGWLHPQTG